MTTMDMTTFSTNTALTVASDAPLLHPLCAGFPGLELRADASEEEVDRFSIQTTEYTGSATENVDAYLTTKHPRTGEVLHNPLCCMGCLVYEREINDREHPGQMKENVGTVLKIVSMETGEVTYISFGSVAATNFVKRVIKPTRNIGNFKRPLFIEIESKGLTVGHTYTFKVVASPLVRAEVVVEEVGE